MLRHAVRLLRSVVIVLLVGWSAPSYAQPKPITLPRPDTAGGRPLMQVLQERQSRREFRSGQLALPVISNLLWAAFGINRPDGHRTAPSASNQQEIQIYVALPEALYLYDATPHALKPVVAGDLRAATGTQGFVANAAMDLVYVADLSKMTTAAESQLQWAFADAGFIAENAYLFCASERLATVVRASIDRTTLAARMQLRPDQRILLAQSVGYAKATVETTR